MQYTISELKSHVAQLYSDKLKPNQTIFLEPFGYSMSVAAFVGATGAVSNQINIQANADFLCLGISHRAQIAAAQNVSTKTAPFVRILVTDNGSGKQWTNSAVDLENYSSNDGKIRLLDYPRLVGGRSSLTVALAGWAGAAETYSIDVFFSGLNVWIIG